MLDALFVLAGVAAIGYTAGDVFQSVIVPRPAARLRLSAIVTRSTWRACRRLGLRMLDPDRREDFYGTYAPTVLLAILVLWVALLMCGFGAIFYGLRSALHPSPTTLGSAIYYAGTSLLTLGYGDIAATSGITRALSLVAAAFGLGTFAVVTAYLFAVFAAFQRREAFIVTLRERIGAPPSGASYLLKLIELEMLYDIPETFRLAEAWMADLMETHLAYPALSYFRSTHDGQSWVATIGALLDAAALIVTTVDVGHRGRARMLSRLGRHLVVDFGHVYRFDPVQTVGIEAAEFAKVHALLAGAGVAMHDLDEAWQAFSALRATYAGPLNAMAEWWRIPPAQWIGDRSPLPARHQPVMPQPIANTP
jgi:hypothetical protein